jgi:predicted MFS family arabinose efflux permease
MLGDANGNGGRIAIVANSTESVFVLNNAGELIYRVDAGANFTSAQFVDIDEENNLYIYDKNFGGVKEQNTERVVKYSPNGKFLDELYSYQYVNEDFILSKGKISGIAVSDGLLYVVRLEHEGFYLEWTSAEQKTETHQLAFFPYSNAFRDLAYCRISIEEKRVVFTTKSGVILRYSFSGNLITTIPSKDGRFPYMTVQGERSDFIYVDIINNVIAKIDSISWETANLFSPSNGCYYYIAYKNGVIYASNNEENVLVIQNDGGFKTIDSYTYSRSDVVFRIVLFVFCVLDIAAFLLFLIPLIRFLRKKKLKGNFKLILLVTFCVILGAGVSSVLIINEMNNQYYHNLGNNLENMLKIIANAIDLKVIRSINSPAQFSDADFEKFVEDVRNMFIQLEFEGKQIYFTIWIERNGEIYSMFDLDYALGTFYPYGEYADSFLQETYDSKRFIYEVVHTGSGTWIGTSGAVFDADGEPIAALEIGYSLQSVEKEQQDMVIQLTLIVISTIVAFLLIMIEFILIFNAYKQNKNEIMRKSQALIANPGLLKSIVSILTNAYNKNKDENRPVKFQPRLHKAVLYYLARTYNSAVSSFHPELLRAAIFFLYLAASFDKAILPLYAEQLYIPLFGLPKEMIVTLPFTLQVSGSILAHLIAPSLLEKIGIKRIAFISSILFLIGNILCFIVRNIIFLSVGYGFSGFSGSSLMMVFNTIIGAQKNKSDINKGFAHLNASYLAGVNVGVIFGSIIAQFLPYRFVFFFASIFSVVLLVIVVFSIRSKLVNYLYEIVRAEKERVERFALFKFIFKPVVFCSLICLLLPYSTAMSFTDYFMPFFGVENGIAESNIGQLMLLSGLFAILFGASLCEYVSKKFSMETIIIASLLFGAAGIFLFALQPSVSLLITAIIILAVANIFAFTNIQTYYAFLYQNSAVSSIKAQSVYSTIENISLAVGPIVFSYILTNNISLGMKLFAAVMIGCVALFAAASGFSALGRKGKSVPPNNAKKPETSAL